MATPEVPLRIVYRREAPAPRIALFIDGANVYLTREPGTYMNYRALLDFAGQYGTVVIKRIYLALTSNSRGERDLIAALERMGYTVIARPVRYAYDGTRKSDIDVEIGYDIGAAIARQDPPFESICLASGDYDFTPVFRNVRQSGRQVISVGPDWATAWEMKQLADVYVPVDEVPGLMVADRRTLEFPLRQVRPVLTHPGQARQAGFTMGANASGAS